MAVPALSQAQGQGRTRNEQRRRNEIRLMEGVLVQAVRLGAEEVSTEMQRFEPAGVTVLSGVPRARGFLLDGYGVFFDVEIPDMNQSVIWSMMNVQRDRQVGNALDSLRAALETHARRSQPATGADGAPAGHQDRRSRPCRPAARRDSRRQRPGQVARRQRHDARSQRPVFRRR